MISSAYYFGSDLRFVNAQEKSSTSDPETPFTRWYEEQKKYGQIVDPLAVKIESPAKGQEVPSNQRLDVTGISSDNSTSDCKVSVIVNGIRPYQPAVARGTGGTNDYSTWDFMITPEYATIEEGPDNKITSKLECTPNLTKWYSVNVTGVDTAARIDGGGQTPFLSAPSSPVPLSSDDVQGTGSAGGGRGSSSLGPSGNAEGPALSISLDILEDPVGEQTVEATVLDADSNSPIEDALIELVLTDSDGNIIDEFSDEDGDISHIVETDGTEGLEELTATVQASAAGYEPGSETITFDIAEEGGDASAEGDDTVDDGDNDDDTLGELFE